MSNSYIFSSLLHTLKSTLFSGLFQLIKTEHVKPNEEAPKRLEVVKELEDDAHAPRERAFRLPNSHVQWVTYLLDKYSEEDYEVIASSLAMVVVNF